MQLIVLTVWTIRLLVTLGAMTVLMHGYYAINLLLHTQNTCTMHQKINICHIYFYFYFTGILIMITWHFYVSCSVYYIYSMFPICMLNVHAECFIHHFYTPFFYMSAGVLSCYTETLNSNLVIKNSFIDKHIIGPFYNRHDNQ